MTNRVLKNDTPPSLGFAQGTCGFSMPYKNMREGSLCYVRVLQVPQVAHPPCVFLYYHTMKKSINNSIKAFAMAAIATMFSMSIASCDDDDDVLTEIQKVEEPETYGLVVNEMSMDVATWETTADFGKDNHMEIVGGKTEVRKGDSFSVKFNLFNSYVVKSVKVNGVDMTSNVKDNVLTVDVNNDIVNGKDSITIDAVYDMNLTFKVTAEFTNNEKTEVEYHITPSVEGVKYLYFYTKRSVLTKYNLWDGDVISASALRDYCQEVINQVIAYSSISCKNAYFESVREYAELDILVVACRMDKDGNLCNPEIWGEMNKILGLK